MSVQSKYSHRVRNIQYLKYLLNKHQNGHIVYYQTAAALWNSHWWVRVSKHVKTDINFTNLLLHFPLTAVLPKMKWSRLVPIHFAKCTDVNSIFCLSWLWNNQQMCHSSSIIYWYILNFTPTCFSNSLPSSGYTLLVASLDNRPQWTNCNPYTSTTQILLE
jgi:hypothetical protein